MKHLLKKLGIAVAFGLFALVSYANPYNIVLKQVPKVLSNTNPGYIVYEVSTKEYQRLSAGVGHFLPGTAQTTFNPNVALYDRICGNPFNLGAPNSTPPNYCYLVLAVSGAAFPSGGQVSGSITICDSPPLPKEGKENEEATAEGNCFYAPGVNFPVVVGPQTTITVSPATITLGPNATASWIVTNTGADPAHNINVNFGKITDDFSSITIPTACAEIAGSGGTCTISATVSANPIFITPPSGVEITFFGDNTNQVSTTVVIVNSSGELVPIGSADIVIEDSPDYYCVVYQNILTGPGNDIQINSVTLGAGTTGVSIAPAAPGLCNNDPLLAPGATCSVCYNAPSTAADGSATYDINYTPAGGPPTVDVTGTVSVLPTTLAIIPSPILVPQPGAGVSIYTLEVSGPFNLVGAPSQTLSGTTGITLNPLPAGCTNLAVGAAPATCQPTYSYVNGSTATGDAALTVTGSNVDVPAVASVVISTAEGPDITPTPASAGGQHLQYRSITIDNAVNPSTSYPLSANLSGISGYAQLCSSSNTVQNCEYLSTCTGTYSSDGTTFLGNIAGGATCQIWVGSITPTNQAFGVQGPGVLTLTGGTKPAVTFNIYQELALYATGLFNQAGTTTGINNIAKYDGTGWSKLNYWRTPNVSVGTDNGLTGGEGNVVEAYRGDLYVGGTFNNASGAANSRYVASWNGFAWNGLASSSANRLNGLVYDLAPMTNANGVSGTTLPLYIGGQFSSAGGVTARNMAQYTNNVSGINGILGPLAGTTGAGVGPTGSGAVVYGLFASGNSVYTAGAFSSISPGTVSGLPDNIAVWNYALPTSFWNSLDDGLNNITGGGYTNAATTVSNGDVYATGGFLGTFNSLFPCFFSIPLDINVMKFNAATGCWEIADGNDPFPSGLVGPGYDIITDPTDTFPIVGGLFPCRADLSDFGNTPINNVTYLGGGQWQRLGGGLGNLTTIFGTNYCVPGNLFEINYVYTLTTYNNMLYAGGFFNISEKTSYSGPVTGLHNIAVFPLNNLTTGVWSGIDGGVQLIGNPSNVVVTGIAITSSLLLQ